MDKSPHYVAGLGDPGRIGNPFLAANPVLFRPGSCFLKVDLDLSCELLQKTIQSMRLE